MKKGLQLMNHNSHVAMWSERVASCRASGQTVAEWCKSEKIPVSTYYSWQRKLFQKMQEVEHVCFTEIPVSSKIIPPALATLHSDGLKIELHSGEDVEFLRNLVQILKSC